MDDALIPSDVLAAKRIPQFPGESNDYAQAREALLAEEIEVRRHLTRLADQRQALPPGPAIAKDYRFTDGNGDDVGLADLFGDHDTLVTYFWMYGPQRERPCPMCTNLLGGLNGNARDIEQRAALKILGRSCRRTAAGVRRGPRLARPRLRADGGRRLRRDLGALDADGNESPAFVVYQKDGEAVRLFYSGEMPVEAADPGQDPRASHRPRAVVERARPHTRGPRHRLVPQARVLT